MLIKMFVWQLNMTNITFCPAHLMGLLFLILWIFRANKKCLYLLHCCVAYSRALYICIEYICFAYCEDRWGQQTTWEGDIFYIVHCAWHCFGFSVILILTLCAISVLYYSTVPSRLLYVLYCLWTLGWFSWIRFSVEYIICGLDFV